MRHKIFKNFVLLKAWPKFKWRKRNTDDFSKFLGFSTGAFNYGAVGFTVTSVYYEAETCPCCISWSIVALFYPYPVTGHFLLPQTRCGIKWMEWDIFFRYNSVTSMSLLTVGHGLWHIQKNIYMKCVDIAFFKALLKAERSVVIVDAKQCWSHGHILSSLAFFDFVFKC